MLAFLVFSLLRSIWISGGFYLISDVLSLVVEIREVYKRVDFGVVSFGVVFDCFFLGVLDLG